MQKTTNFQTSVKLDFFCSPSASSGNIYFGSIQLLICIHITFAQSKYALAIQVDVSIRK